MCMYKTCAIVETRFFPIFYIGVSYNFQINDQIFYKKYLNLMKFPFETYN